jgi:hypothetical protein
MQRLVLFALALTSVLLATARESASQSHAREAMTIQLAVDPPMAEAPYAGPVLPPSPSAITWYIVDSMANAFGPASWAQKPMAYDPGTGWLVVIHRGHAAYAAGSGQLWYNRSTDGGMTWRRVSELNAGLGNFSRYPTVAISNPTRSSDTTQAILVFLAPQLIQPANVFGINIYGVDINLGAGVSAAFIDAGGDSTLRTENDLYTDPSSQSINMVTYRYTATVTHNDMWRFLTTDFATSTAGVPAGWEGSVFADIFGLDINGTFRNGNAYLGKWGVFAGPGDSSEIDNFGYSKSTDKGMTWGAWQRPQPDWRSVPGLEGFFGQWYYGGAGAYSTDMLVDANDKVHFFGVVEDSVGQRSVIELYEGSSGWASNVIQGNLRENTPLIYATLNQMGNHLNASISEDGTVMTLVWLDGDAVADSVADIWFSFRNMNSSTWSTPQNLTQTPTFGEYLLHAAPQLKSNGGSSYTLFLGRSYEAGNPPYSALNDANPTYFYAGSFTFNAVTSVRNRSGLPGEFALAQNYPNPFNPDTRIRFSIPEKSAVSLTVFNALGQKVAPVVNGVLEAGSHEAAFSARDLASGIYFYTLQAGNFIATKKMVVLK